ncbi:MAG: hypothetical protein WC627_01245 [Legionella sp.]
MRIRLSELANPRYIHVNPQTNTVHLMVPVTSGMEIALDNTCQTVVALQEFFGKRADSDEQQSSARHELERYKKSLEDDVAAMANSEEKRRKQERLTQTNSFLAVLRQVEAHHSLNQLTGGLPNYPGPIIEVLRRANGNLKAMLLRPTAQDGMLNAQNPVFSVDRARPANTLYHRLMNVFATITRVTARTPKQIFINRVIDSFKNAAFPQTAATVVANIITELTTVHKQMFGDNYNINFAISNEELVNLAYDDPQNDTVDSLAELNGLIENISGKADERLQFPPASSFNTITMPIVAETLSIMTQFLLAEINIFASVYNLSNQNFGAILDRKFANILAETIKTAIETGHNVEETVCQFINNHRVEFGLVTAFTPAEIAEISRRFNAHYQIIKDSPHKDEFMVLDTTRQGQACYYTHQNSICFDFVDLLQTNVFRSYDRPEFANARQELPNMPIIIPARDAAAVGFNEIDVTVLIAQMRLAIRNNNFQEARKILSLTGDSRRVFEELGRDFFREFDANPTAQNLFIQLRRTLRDALVSNSFNRIVRGQEAQLVLTPTLARSLYTAVADSRNLQPNRILKYNTVADINALLADLGFPGNHSITASHNNDMVIDSTRATIEGIQQIINRYNNTIHLAMPLAASLYKQVGESYGKQSPQYLEMEALHNQPNPDGRIANKLLKALELLHINIGRNQVAYNNAGHGGSGYIIRNVQADDLRSIEEIHNYQANRFYVSPEMARSIYQTISRLDAGAAREMNRLNNVHRPDKFEVALALLNINYRRVEFGPNNEGYMVYIPFEEQAKLKAIARIPLNIDEQAITCNYRPVVIEHNIKSNRGFLIEQIRQRAREADAQAQNVPAPVINIQPMAPRLLQNRLDDDANMSPIALIPRRLPQPMPAAIEDHNDPSRAALQLALRAIMTNITQTRNQRQTWFKRDPNSKADKLQNIINWLGDTNHALTAERKFALLALIRDVCAIKRNVLGFYNPHSLNEFNAKLEGWRINSNVLNLLSFDVHQLENQSIVEILDNARVHNLVP